MHTQTYPSYQSYTMSRKRMGISILETFHNTTVRPPMMLGLCTAPNIMLM